MAVHRLQMIDCLTTDVFDRFAFSDFRQVSEQNQKSLYSSLNLHGKLYKLNVHKHVCTLNLHNNICTLNLNDNICTLSLQKTFVN